MRRSVLAIIGTVAGTALMVGAKLGTPPADPNAAALDAAGGGPSSDAGSAPPAPGGSGAASSAPAPGPSGSSAAPGPGPTSGKPTPPGQPTPATNGRKNGTFTGTGAAAKKYEVVTVTITVSGGRITVATGSCGNASGDSRDICQGAMPKLQQETLSAQSAGIATVSGATYTSNAYKASLQSALDQAKA